MKKLPLLLALFAVFSFLPGNTFADIAIENPKPPKTKELDSSLLIKLDRNAKEAKLVVPRNMIKELRAALDEADDSGIAASTNGFGSTQTIVAGLLMSLAIGFGGVWFVRTKKTGGKNASSAAVIAFLCLSGTAAATVVFANVGPPPAARSITSRLFDKKVLQPYGFASGKIKIEISDTANFVELRVPQVEAEKSE